MCNMHAPKITRRNFLKIAGVTGGALVLPSAFGYSLLQSAEGELPPNGSPYALTYETDGFLLKEVNTPLLVLLNEGSDNPFGLYLTEILRAEGLNCFQITHLTKIDKAMLEQFGSVLLAEGPVHTAQIEMLESFVAQGGQLVAMRPSAGLAPLFGVESVPGNTAEGYIQVEANHPTVKGIAVETLQFHGQADHYRVTDAQVVAWLAKDANTRTDFPAVTINKYGQGQAIMWAYDLARSVAYTRQGNPAVLNQEVAEWEGIRAVNMFRDWIDLDRISIPQADEQQRLLLNLLTSFSQERAPMPRLWYFPGKLEGIVVATGDSHINPTPAIEEDLAYVEKYGGHMTIYYTPLLVSDWGRAARNVRFWATDHLPLLGSGMAEQFVAPTPSIIANWRARGHEFGLHPYVEEGLEAGWQRFWQEFTGRGYGPVSRTVRTHRVLWTGWVETARLQASYGIRMNMDYYHWGPLFQKTNGEWAFGYFTGSGLPMKFVDEQGRILNIYQQLTHLADDHMLNLHWGGVAKLPPEEAVKVSQEFLRRSVDNTYGATVVHFHADPFQVGGESAVKARQFLQGTLDAAESHGLPVWSTEEWLRFTEVRHDANFIGLQWHPEGKRLSFQLESPEETKTELTVMIPLSRGESNLVEVEVDGKLLEFGERKLGGISYGAVSTTAGSHDFVVTYV